MPPPACRRREREREREIDAPGTHTQILDRSAPCGGFQEKQRTRPAGSYLPPPPHVPPSPSLAHAPMRPCTPHASPLLSPLIPFTAVSAARHRPKQTHHPGRVFHAGRPEVPQLEVPVPGDEEVGRLHVPVNSLVAMQEIEGLGTHPNIKRQARRAHRKRACGQSTMAGLS